MRYPYQRICQSGVTLVELMVVLVIGLVVSMAIMAIMSVSEGHKRTTTSVNDINQSGAYTLYEIDKNVRSAGTGFAQIADFLKPGPTNPYRYPHGCKLHASKNGMQVLPVPGVLPAPFGTIVSSLGAFRLVPVIIASGAAQGAPNSDILITMSGGGGFAQIPIPVEGPITSATDLPLKNSVSFAANDLLLVVDPTPAPATAGSLCLLEQVHSAFVSNAAPPIPLGGDFYSATGPDPVAADVRAYTGYSAGSPMAAVLNLGQRPAFKLYGVGANNTLYSYDLLNSAVADEVADGVFDMRALYGVVDAAGVLSWHAPTEVGYTATDLLTGLTAASDTIQTIQAIRIGMILRSSLKEKVDTAGNQVSPATLTLFSDYGALSYTKNLATADRDYRYRTFEATIPVRNMILR